MATPIAFDIFGRDRGASSALEKVGNKADQTGRKFGFLSTRSNGLTAGMTAGFGKVVAAMGAVAAVSVFKGFIDEARESRKVGALTESIIKSTGGAAKVTAKQVGALAASISNKTGVDDEAIQSGSNLLLTFKNVRNEVGKGAKIFDRATQAAVDLSAAGFGDVNSASKMLGKALNDPLKGISALGKAGVTFTADQKKQIATLVETGKTLEAQKIILQEVESQVGGAAAAAADPMAKLGVIIGNVKETIGTAFLPIVDKAATWLGERLPGAVDKAGRFFSERLLPPLKTITGFVQDRVIPVVSDIVTKFSGLGSKIVGAIGTIDLGGIADDIWTGASKWAGSLIGGLKAGIDKGDWKPLGTAVGNGIVAALRGAGEVAGKLLDAVGALLDKVDWGKLGSRISAGITGMLKAVDWKMLGEALGDAVVSLAQKTTTLGEKMGKAFKDLMDRIDWQKIGHDSTTSIGKFLTGVDWGQLAKTLGMMALKSLKINKSVYDSVVNSAAELVIGIGKAIVDEIEVQRLKFVGWTKKVGEDLISGLWSGIKTGMSGAGKFLKSTIVDPVVNSVKSFFGVRSPSTVFATIGRDLISGLLGGISARWKDVARWLSGMKSSVLRWIGDTTRTLEGRGKGFISGLLSGLAARWKDATRWISGLRSSVLAWLGDTSKTLVGKGRSFISGLLSGMAERWKDVTKWVSGLKASVSAWLGSTGTFLVQKGRDVLWGFLGGMKAVWTDVTKWVGGIATWIKDHKGPVSLDGRLLIPAGQAIMSGFLKGLKSGAGPAWDFVTSVGGKTKDALAGAIGGPFTGGGDPAPTNLSAMQALVRTVAAGRGWGTGPQWNALYNLIMGESGFNPNAQNPTSSAYGIFQFLDSTWASVGASKTSDPWAQTAAGLRYIANSYGSPANAYAKWSSRSPHWYEKGTPWVPNDQLAYVHRGEGIIPADVNRRLRAAPMRPGNSSGARIVLEVRPGNFGPFEQMFLTWLKNAVRVKGGGNVQVALGSGRG